MSHQFPKRHVLKKEMNWLQLHSSLSPSHRTTGAVSVWGVRGGGGGVGAAICSHNDSLTLQSLRRYSDGTPSHSAAVTLVSPNVSNEHKMGHIWASTKHLIDFFKRKVQAINNDRPISGLAKMLNCDVNRDDNNSSKVQYISLLFPRKYRWHWELHSGRRHYGAMQRPVGTAGVFTLCRTPCTFGCLHL